MNLYHCHVASVEKKEKIYLTEGQAITRTKFEIIELPHTLKTYTWN